MLLEVCLFYYNLILIALLFFFNYLFIYLPEEIGQLSNIKWQHHFLSLAHLSQGS